MFRTRFNGPPNDEGSNTTWADVTLLLALGFVALLLILALHVNPKAKKVEEGAVQRENVKIEVTWPPELDTDVDTWVQAPGDVPVGYSNKGGVSCDLRRDDLGHYADVLNINYEDISCRGILPGEYTVNLHLYRNLSSVSVIPVRVVLSVRAPGGMRVERILTRDVELLHLGEEITVFRFALNENGTLVPGSETNLFKPLRSSTDYGNGIPAG
ncbi:MAG: hypothetical protein AAB727_03775 [Patescibacteria group bacterium]